MSSQTWGHLVPRLVTPRMGSLVWAASCGQPSVVWTAMAIDALPDVGTPSSTTAHTSYGQPRVVWTAMAIDALPDVGTPSSTTAHISYGQPHVGSLVSAASCGVDSHGNRCPPRRGDT